MTDETRLEEAVDGLRALHAARWSDYGGAVHVRLDGPVGEVVLDHPPARHALTTGMMVALGEAACALADAPCVALVWRSSDGRAFCAGGHLGQVRAELVQGESGRAMSGAMATVMDAFWTSPVIQIAAVEGPAVGGGAELLTAMDLSCFGPRGRAAFRQVGLGVTAGWGGARRLVAGVGRARALRWLTVDPEVDGPSAEAAGFGLAVDDARAAAEGLAARLAALPAPAVRAAKRQVASDDAAEHVDAFASVWGGPAHRQALGLTPTG